MTVIDIEGLEVKWGVKRDYVESRIRESRVKVC